MTKPQPFSAFRSDPQAEFNRLRSHFMDAFARLEIAVVRRLQALDIQLEHRKCCFDQLVEALGKAKPSPRLSKANVADLARLPQDCEPLQRLRASMAHGVMEVVKGDVEPLAIFRNALDVIDGWSVCHALTEDDFRRYIKALGALEARAATSPSSPPPRAPAEAAGP